MNATYLDENGKPQLMEMGCYGIGVTRLLGAADRAEPRRARHRLAGPDGAVRGRAAPIGYERSAEVSAAADRLHDELAAEGVDVMLDDRGERPARCSPTGS